MQTIAKSIIYRITIMKKILVTMSVCVLFSLAGCIDRGFELTDVSGEITVGGEELTLPLAKIDNIYLGDLLKENDVITNDDNGIYQIKFADEGGMEIAGVEIPAIRDLSPELEPVKFNIATIPTTYTIDDIQQNLELEAPSLTDLVDIDAIDITHQIEIPEILQQYLTGEGTIDESITAIIPALESATEEDKPITSSFNAKIEVSEGVSAVDYVLFGDENTPGAELLIEMDLGGIEGVTESGTLEFELVFPDGYYFGHYVNSVYQSFPQESHNIVKDVINLSGKSGKSATKKVYLERINYYDHQIGENGMLTINDDIVCNYDLSIKIGGGYFNLTSEEYLPKLHVKAIPIYKDIEVVIGDFNLDHVTYDFKQEFAGIPKQVNIKKLAFDDSSVMTLSMSGLDWLKVYDNETKEQFSPYMEIILPSCMHFRKEDHGEVHIENNIIRASLSDLKQGVPLILDYIDCLDSSIKRDAEKLIIDSTIESVIHMESLKGHKVLVSNLMPESSPVMVEFGMTNMILNVDGDNSDVEWGEGMEFNLDLKDQMPSISQEIEIPSMIAAIDSIEIGKEGSEGEPVSIKFELGIQDNKTFPVDEVELDILVNLGKILRPTENCLKSGLISVNDNGDKLLSINCVWLPNSGKLEKIAEFNALENLPEIIDGKLKIDQNIVVERCIATIKGNQDVQLEAINDIAIDMDIAIDNIEARKFSGKFDIAVAPEEMVVELGDLSTLGVDINKLSLNPVLSLYLEENPTGIPIFANVELKTLDAEGNQLAEIVISDIEIAGSGASNIVISTPYNADKYHDVTFVEVDNLSELLSNGIPAKIAVNMSVATNKNETYTIDLTRASKGYNLNYKYEVVVPLEFDGDVDLSYKSQVTGLNDTFANLANNVPELKVGDIGLIAELNTTIPFDIELDAKFINKEGTSKGIDATLTVGNDGIIEGWRESDGENPHTTKLDLNLDLGDSHSLEALENIDGIEFSFRLSKADSDKTVALKDTQYLNGKLKLRVRDGLTVDILDLLNSEGE